ncbi:serine hydrolase [Microbacterium sp.]|uniref:serine hydrolase domain-containing protein n=1 Tax=Microbacterium sp. TaxID=51671 RepID=UPI002735F843|nr:serine hydrolase domain-containing protein [Microbacterium sp.]MDP3950951.1 serine hydrolase domain-containing protein [Microbacterium sp.]
MDSPEEVAEFLRTELALRATARGVPAAAVAVVIDGEIIDHAVGVLSTATGVEATAESVFQIGSITKVWTATLVMQLVDEGLVELDEPIRSYLPEFRLGDDSATGSITVRQLLTHQAGFEGDIFTDTGRGDDAIEKFVDLLAEMPQTFPPGLMFSYNNAGFIVLGHLVERIREKTWEQALLEHIAAPLGLERVSPSPYEAILHRVAVGHMGPGADGALTAAPMWAMARSNEPAGSMLAMTARDLAGFARMHLAGGTAPDGTVILSPSAVEAMRTTSVRLPVITGLGTAWGLGWEIDRDDDVRLYGHDGNTIGQASYLRIAQDAQVAIVLLTNGGDGMGLLHDIVDPLLRALTGEGLPAAPVPAAEPHHVDAAPYIGTYSNSIFDLDVSQDDAGRVWLEQRPKGLLLEMGEQPSRDELISFGEDSLIMREEKNGMHIVYTFLSPDSRGRHAFVQFGRAIARTA